MIEKLERQRICTLIEFIDEDSEKLVKFTGLLLKVYIYIYIYIYKYI